MAFEEFDRQESSQSDGSPIRLYLLEWGKTSWRYTSADQAVFRYEMVPDDDGTPVRTLVEYVPVPCNDEGMTQGGSSNNAFTLHVPGNLPVVELFRSTPPTESIWLTVRTIHAPKEQLDLPVISAPHKHWRLYFTLSRSDYYSVEEIYLRGERGGPNLADNVNGTATSLSTYGAPDYTADKAFDGNPDTIFHTGGGGDQWIAYEFDEPTALAEVSYRSRRNFPLQTPKSGRVEFSDDGEHWTTFFDFELSPFTDGETKMLGPPLSVREVDAPIYWIGTVGNIKRPDPAEATILGRPITATFKRVGLRLCWTRGCPHALYDDECRVDPEDWRKTGTVFMAGGAQVVVEMDEAITDASRYIGGIFEWEADAATGTKDSRTIEMASGSDTTLTLTIFGTADRITADAVCSVLPGCDLTPETCSGRFNNLANYGGFKQMAGKSPFDGTPVF